MFTPLNHVTALNNVLQSEYQSSYDVAAKNRWANLIANETAGAGVAEIREFLVEDLKIRVGLGAEYSDLRTHSMTVEHQQAAGGFEVRDRDFKTAAALTVKTDAARALGVKASLLGQELLLKLINSAATKAYDGLSFFAAGHFNNYKDNSQGTFDNTEAGKDLTNENLGAAVAAIESRQMADGTPRNLKAKWLLHGPELKFKAQLALNAQFINATNNPTSGDGKFLAAYDLTPVCIPGLAKVGGKSPWIVAGELEGGGSFAKPFGISTLVPVTMTNYDGVTVPMLQIMQQLEYLVTGDLAAYVGHPYLVHRCLVP